MFGSASYTNGTWVVSGGGTDICFSDQLHFVWKPVTGDGMISARLTQLEYAPNAQAGLMYRSDSSAGAVEVAVLGTASN
ncbi:MAG TPA: cellulose 1,4-beta-cellobiosidase, partial [Clostridia bacterium]|nr:cellulose 1,4-beta-cellobiosidase [Clostridia bacterium]